MKTLAEIYDKDNALIRIINDDMCCDGLRRTREFIHPNLKKIIITSSAYTFKEKYLKFYEDIIKELFPEGVEYFNDKLKVKHKLRVEIDLEIIPFCLINIIWAIFRIPFYCIGSCHYKEFLKLDDSINLWDKLFISNSFFRRTGYDLFSTSFINYINFKDYISTVKKKNKAFLTKLNTPYQKFRRNLFESVDFAPNVILDVKPENIIKFSTIDNVKSFKVTYRIFSADHSEITFKKKYCRSCTPQNCGGCSYDEQILTIKETQQIATNEEIENFLKTLPLNRVNQDIKNLIIKTYKK
jgi:hypothetical protein